jgi:transposase-like protein
MQLPNTLLEAVRHFTSEVNCHNFMVDLRWPDGKITCPHCQSQNVGKLVVTQHKSRSRKEGVEPKTLTRRLWNCKGCKKQFTTKTGTIFEQSPLGLDKWLPAVWNVVNCKNGVSSYELHRGLGVTQKTAWFMGHRIRTALQNGSLVKMEGVVEADESYIGPDAKRQNAQQKGRRKYKGQGPWNRSVVQGLLERGERAKHGKASRVVVKHVPNNTRYTLEPNVRQYVLKGSELHTDQHPGYSKLAAEYDHQIVNHAIAYVRGNVHTNGLENFWCLLKRMVKGTYVCPSVWHLSRYLDEQAYRFNLRRETDQDRFVGAMQGVNGRRLTYQRLIGSESAAF